MTFLLGGSRLTADDVAAVADHGARVAVAPHVWPRLDHEQAVLAQAVENQDPVYGVTTGLGARVHTHVGPAEQHDVGVRTVRARATGTGVGLATPIVRAAMLARAASLARGGSAVSPAVLRLLVDMLNHGVHPQVPEVGSIGASDLTQMAHVALVLAGEGAATVHGHGHCRLDGASALTRTGLHPVPLTARDGLALCSSSPLATATTALCLSQLQDLLESAARVTALSFEGWRADPGILDEAVLALRPQPGQQRAAAHLKHHLAGGSLASHSRRRLQDPLSFRCVPATHGALLHALDALSQTLAGELNGNGDNPAVLNEHVVPTGNFHTPLLALNLDQAALAVAQTAALSGARLQRLLEPQLSGLPENLTRHGPSRSGLAPTVKTAQALLAKIRHSAAPTSLDPRTGAASVEDHSTNASLAAQRLTDLLGWWTRLLAIEALAAAQACDLHGPDIVLGASSATLHANIRDLSPHLDDDRPLSEDINQVTHLLTQRNQTH